MSIEQTIIKKEGSETSINSINDKKDISEQKRIVDEVALVENKLEFFEDSKKDELASFCEDLKKEDAKEFLLHEINDSEIQKDVIHKNWSSIKDWIVHKGWKVLPKNKLSRILACTILLNSASPALGQETYNPKVKEKPTLSMVSTDKSNKQIENLFISEDEKKVVEYARKIFPDFFERGILSKSGKFDKDYLSGNILSLINQDHNRIEINSVRNNCFMIYSYSDEEEYIVDEAGRIKFTSYKGEPGDMEQAEEYLNKTAEKCKTLEDVSQFLQNYMIYDHNNASIAVKGDLNQKLRSAVEIVSGEKDERMKGVCVDYSFMACELIRRSSILNKKYVTEVFDMNTFATEKYNIGHAYAVVWDKEINDDLKIYAIDNHGIFDITNSKGSGAEIKKFLNKGKVGKSNYVSISLNPNIAVTLEEYFSNDREQLLKENKIIQASFYEQDLEKKIKMLEPIVAKKPDSYFAVQQIFHAYLYLDKMDEAIDVLMRNMKTGKASRENLRNLLKYSVFVFNKTEQDQVKKKIKELYPGFGKHE